MTLPHHFVQGEQGDQPGEGRLGVLFFVRSGGLEPTSTKVKVTCFILTGTAAFALTDKR
jgi:hypothetical protein